MAKPLQIKELKKKISVSIHNRENQKQIYSEKQAAIDTAMTALSNAGELGFVLDFMRKSYLVESAEDLASLIIDTCKDFSVRVSVQIRTLTSVTNKSTKNPIPPLEAELLYQLKESGRIVESEDRLIANFRNISLLITTMPHEDEKRGRLRDHLAILLESAEIRLKAIETQQELTNVVQTAKNTLERVKALQLAKEKSNTFILTELRENILSEIHYFGLSDVLENDLVSIVEKQIKGSVINTNKEQMIDDHLLGIIQLLNSLLSQKNS